MTTQHHRRTFAMRLLRNGEVTVREAAMLADVSRQRVLVWCATAGIDPKAARQAWLALKLAALTRRELRR